MLKVVYPSEKVNIESKKEWIYEKYQRVATKEEKRTLRFKGIRMYITQLETMLKEDPDIEFVTGSATLTSSDAYSTQTSSPALYELDLTILTYSDLRQILSPYLDGLPPGQNLLQMTLERERSQGLQDHNPPLSFPIEYFQRRLLLYHRLPLILRSGLIGVALAQYSYTGCLRKNLLNLKQIMIELGSLAHYLRYEISHCVEEPNFYIVRIECDSQDGHLKGFRTSPEFQTIFESVCPFFDNIEEMCHYELTG